MLNGFDKIKKTPFRRVAARFYIFQHVKFLTQNKMLVLGKETSILILFLNYFSQFMFQFQTNMSNLEPNSRCIYSKIKKDNSEYSSSYKTRTRLLFNFC
jgi:hypothetical protein